MGSHRSPWRSRFAAACALFNVDVQVEIVKLADDSKVVNLERRSYKLPETNTTPADLEKTAVTDAVRETLALTLKKYPL